MVYTDGACMKHSKQWRSWSEWVANEFRKRKKDDIARINLKPEPFTRGFMNLLCTCDEDGKNKPQLKAINGMMVLLIRRGNRDNLEIILLISP